jgi:hypothetical protein
MNPLKVHQASPESERVTLPRWLNRCTLAAGLLSISGFIVGVEVAHVDADQFVPESASGLEFDLNERDHTAEAARVLVGYELPLTNSPVEGAVAIHNPIYLGDKTYGYIAPETQSGKVTIDTVTYSGPLQPAQLGDHVAVNPHYAISPLALVYNEYARLDNGDPSRDYQVVMGEQSGSIDGLSPAQLSDINQSSVGQLVYAGQ